MAFANSLSTALCSEALLPTATTRSTNYLPSLFFTPSPSFRFSLLRRPRHRHRHRRAPIISIRAPKKLLPSAALRNQGEVITTIREEKEMEDLVEAIKGGLNSLGATEEGLLESLELVDLIDRLGISRFIQEETKEIFLKTTFLEWDERYGLGDPATTVLAFRLLRLHGYPVSIGVIENLRGADGKFSSFSIASPAKISAMLNLHRCWQTGFPSESELMEEVKEFSTSQLKKALSEGDPSLLKSNNLGREIRYALTYPRRYNLLRLESRSIIRQLWPTTGYKRMCLQLAKQDLAMLQKIHKEETDALEKWWEEQGVSGFEFARSGIAKAHFAMSVAIFEPEFAAFRMAFTKFACLATLVDDLFDFPELGFDGLLRFTDACLSWDASQLDDLPEHKAVLTSLQNNIVELAAESSRAQGRDLLPFFKNLWGDAAVAFAKEGEWRSKRHVPTWDEYIAAARLTVSAITCIWSSLFLMDHPITPDILSRIGPGSRFMHLVALVARLSNDRTTFRREAACGEVASAVSCYMRDHPDRSEEEALAAVEAAIASACVELEWEVFESRAAVPEPLLRAALNFARTMAFLYMRADAFSTVCDQEYEELLKDYASGSAA